MVLNILIFKIMNLFYRQRWYKRLFKWLSDADNIQFLLVTITCVFAVIALICWGILLTVELINI